VEKWTKRRERIRAKTCREQHQDRHHHRERYDATPDGERMWLGHFAEPGKPLDAS